MSIHKTHPGLIDRARALKGAPNFVRSVLAQYDAGRVLSTKQIDALANIVNSATQNIEQKRAADNAKLAAAPAVNAQNLHAMFDTAKANGLKRLKFRMEEFAITPAKDHSANPGALYVTGNPGGAYYGKIVSGRFIAVAGAPEGIADKINAISENPLAEAKLYGKRTGMCCVCGRELTDPASIAEGIGPICMQNWGM